MKKSRKAKDDMNLTLQFTLHSVQSPLQLAVFAEPSRSALKTVSLLCSFGAEWTSKCEEKLMQLKAEVEGDEVDAADQRDQQLQWLTGLRTCLLHWEKQYRDGVKVVTEVPLEVVKRGAASVKTYLDDANSSNANDVVHRCKVCVVGPSEWGKSSLVRSIETMKPFLMDIRDRTVGVELVATSLSGPAKTPTEANTTTSVDTSTESEQPNDESSSAESPKYHEITFWDFAGQDVYQVAHSLFFSRRTVYVLVIDVDAYSKQLDLVESLKSAAAEASMDRFLSRYVFRWVRTIFARQTDAEFLVLGTKADLLKDEATESLKVWRDLKLRVGEWKYKYMKELEAEYGDVTRVGAGNGRVTELTEKLARLASNDWLVVSVTRPNSIEDVRQAIRHTIEASDRGFPMWTKYSRVLQAVAAKRAAANRPGDGLHRLEHGMMQFIPLCRQLMNEVDGLEYEECREILRTLHDLGDVIWYEHEQTGQLRDFIILDPMLVIDIVREVISHEHKKKTGTVAAANQGSEEVGTQTRIDGRVSHSMLATFPLWKHMDKEMMYAFKMLLNQFRLAYPANDEVMDPESDLIVPSYWNVQLEAASASHTGGAASEVSEAASSAAIALAPALAVSQAASPAVAPAVAASRPNHHCWEYDVSADLSSAIFEQFAVQSYTSFMKRDVRANCIESSCAEFQSWITLHPGATIHDVIRVEVASERADLSWLNMRYYLMKLEKVLDEYTGLAVPRSIVVDGKRHSLGQATKAIRDSIMLGRDVNDLRGQMPWLPPDLDWYMTRAWRDVSLFKELQMMHLVRDKLSVLQKLVVKGASHRRYPALWSLSYESAQRVAVLRMLSDLSGRCYHVPIEIAVPPSFLAKHGSTIKDGVSLLANVVSSSLSVPVLQTALAGAVSCLEAKTQHATTVHNLIDRLDLPIVSGKDAVQTSKDSGLSPGGAMAVLRDLLKLHNDSLDELSITEISNLQCAATSKGEYVWAHADEISMLKKELTPCDAPYEPEPAPAPAPAKAAVRSTEPHDEPETALPGTSRSSKLHLRLSLCIETVTGLADWDWYKTYCTWQLLYGASRTPMASGATPTNADKSAQPSWRSLAMSLGAVGSVEMLRECRLVVQVKRRSRIGWTKLIGEGEVELRALVRDDAKLSFSCDPIDVKLLTSGSVSTDRIVQCKISASY